MDERRQNPHQQEHRPSAVVGDQVQRGIRTVGRSDGRKVPGNRQIVDVVPGGRRQRSRLSPAGHAAVDEGRVASETFLGSQAEAFGHSGPVTFDQDVGGGCEAENHLDSRRLFEIDDDATSSLALWDRNA